MSMISSLDKENKPSTWLITLVDLISLLITFFIMLLSMSDISPLNNFDTLVEGFPFEQQGPENELKGIEQSVKLSPVLRGKLIPLSYAQNIIKNQLSSYPELKNITFRRENDSLVLQIKESDLFKDHHSVLKSDQMRFLNIMAKFLSQMTNKITIAGVVYKKQGEIKEGEWEKAIKLAYHVSAELYKLGMARKSDILGYINQNEASNSKDPTYEIEIHIYDTKGT